MCIPLLWDGQPFQTCLYENGGEEALRKISKKQPIIKNRVPEHVEKAVLDKENLYLTGGMTD